LKDNRIVEAKGFGSAKPIADNKHEDRQKQKQKS
jgi:outer membrane protein OmpA-like peptidoglycan-associated protein